MSFAPLPFSNGANFLPPEGKARNWMLETGSHQTDSTLGPKFSFQKIAFRNAHRQTRAAIRTERKLQTSILRIRAPPDSTYCTINSKIVELRRNFCDGTLAKEIVSESRHGTRAKNRHRGYRTARTPNGVHRLFLTISLRDTRNATAVAMNIDDLTAHQVHFRYSVYRATTILLPLFTG